MQRYFIRTETLNDLGAKSAALLLIGFGRVRKGWEVETFLDIVSATEESYREWYALALTVNDDDKNVVDAYLDPAGLTDGIAAGDEVIELSYSELLALCATTETNPFCLSNDRVFETSWHIERRGILPPRHIFIVDEHGRDIAEVNDKKAAKLMIMLPQLLEQYAELSSMLRDANLHGHADVALAAASRIMCGLGSKER